MRARVIAAGVTVFAATLAMPAALLAQEEPAPAGPTASGPVAGSEPAAPEPEPADDPAVKPAPEPAEGEKRRPSRPAAAGAETAEAGAAVAIGDYFFSPEALSVDVGATITWTNGGEDEDGHTVTAEDGSFDSGVLATGASFSHTFAGAGTVAYFCATHPEMEGTVTVLAADPGDGGRDGDGGAPPDPAAPHSGAGSESAATDASDAAGGSSKLPATGQPGLPPTLAALALLGAGCVVRRLARG